MNYGAHSGPSPSPSPSPSLSAGPSPSLSAGPSPSLSPRPAASGFEPPPYPYDRLAGLRMAAGRHPGGMVDLSIGTPCDPPPGVAIAAMERSRTARGYPASAGSDEYRGAAAGWLERRFGIAIPPGNVAACVGTKELVAGTPWLLRLRSPERDTVLYPAVAYPTYALGAILAGCRPVGVPEAPDGGMDLSAISDEDAARALVLWVNSPSNPTGALSDLEAAGSWGRANGVPVLSDECYVEFTWERWPPETILQHGVEGVLAVHSLSKRSNMAGLRAGFYAGDPELVRYLSEVRKHAGLMVPGPVQAAGAAALGDDEHVAEQRRRYRDRLDRLAGLLRFAGLDARVPAGGFYLWIAAPKWAADRAVAEGRSGGWVLAEALAEAAGMLGSPGELYGDAGAGFVRLAMVQPEHRMDLLESRLVGLGEGSLAAPLPATRQAG